MEPTRAPFLMLFGVYAACIAPAPPPADARETPVQTADAGAIAATGPLLGNCTKEDAENCVSVVVLAKCVVQLDGSLRDCFVIRPSPEVDDKAVLAVLAGWKYSPVIFQGHPQRVQMVIPIRVLGARPLSK